MGVFNLKNRNSNSCELNPHQLYNTRSKETLNGEKDVEEESLETEKSTVLGQQYSTERDSICESHDFDY